MTFRIGDRVWMAGYSTAERDVQCPICFGRRSVTLVLGNGDECVLPCDYCGKGHDGPRGYIVECVAEPRAVECVIDRVTQTATTVEYGAGFTTIRDDLAFASEPEAQVRAVEVAAEEQERRERSANFCKADAQKSFSWNAGYHMREAKRLRAQIEHHERMAVLCKRAAKDDEMRGRR